MLPAKLIHGPILRRLPYREPIDVAGLIAFLGRRAVPGVEEVIDGVYRRSVALDHGPGLIELQAGAGYVDARFWLHDAGDLADAVRRCRALLDLDCDPDAVLAALGSDPVLGEVVRAAPGRRIPGHVDASELALRAVLGQQISVAAATTLAGRLVSAYGAPLDQPIGAVTHLFPDAVALAHADPAMLAMPGARRRALLGLAGALARGELRLDRPAEGAEHTDRADRAEGADRADRAEAERSLLSLPGIGPWTVAYIAMRALGDTDSFLPTDLGVRRGLEALGHDGRPAAAAAMAERWRPYRAYGVQHLWAAAAALAPAHPTTRAHALLHSR